MLDVKLRPLLCKSSKTNRAKTQQCILHFEVKKTILDISSYIS